MRQAFRAGRMVDVDENDNEVSHNNSNENTPLISRASTQVSSVKSRLSSSLTDERAYIRWPAQFLHTTWEVLISNYANILLVFVPLGIVAGLAGWDPVAVFVLNFLAIVPLAGLLAFATEELAAKLGQTIGGLLNATFGNAVELIVSIIALREKQIRIVQASMLGSILSNMLLVCASVSSTFCTTNKTKVLGCCFVAGGFAAQEQVFDVTVAQTMASLMAVASASLIIPATLYASIQDADAPKTPSPNDPAIMVLSRGTSIILLVLYCLYLYFQLYSHANLFDEESGKSDDQNNESSAENHESSENDTHEVKEGDTLSPYAAGIALVLSLIHI